ncbi:MAG: energy transducer TonB, partial [Tsuneonella suprasediminis]
MQTDNPVYEITKRDSLLMRVFMPSLTRAELMGILVSCLGHAALLGGLLAASTNAPHPSRPPPQPETVMVVDFVSLDGRNDSEQPAIRPKSNRPLRAPAVDPRTVAITSTALGPSIGETTTATPSKGDSVSAVPGEAGGALSSTASTALNDYQRRLYEIVARHSRYPSEAGKLRLAGVTCLAFRLDRNGKVLDSWIEHSSGS